MKKYQNKEVLYERLKQLSDIKGSTNENNASNALGTLIDYKKGADGVNYGIVKENHNYFIKKTNNPEPTVADFAYIGGQENKLHHRFKRLSEADKNRNMMLININEAMGVKFNTAKKRVLTEAEEEIEKAEDALDDLEVATAKEKEEPEVATEPDFDAMGMGQDDETPADEPAPEGGEEMPEPEVSDEPAPEGGEEMPEPADEPAPEGEDEPESMEDPEGEEGDEPAPEGEDVDELNREIEKGVGKVTHKIRKAEMTPMQIKSYLNSFIAAFKDKLPNVEIEDRKEMANKIVKVTDDSDIEDLGQEIEDEVNEDIVNECGRFVEFVQERGYNQESIMECGDDEMTNMVSNFMNEYEDLNECDFRELALFVEPHSVNTLADEYGHESAAKELEPFVKTINECGSEEKMKQIGELAWGKGDVKAEAENGVDHVEVQPGLEDNIKEDEKEEDELDLGIDLGDEPAPEGDEEMPEPDFGEEPVSDETPEPEFAPVADNLGAVPPAIDSEKGEKGIDIKDSTVNITMSESEKKMRAYVRKRLQEKISGKKPTLNEDVKSEKLRKLDEMIDEELESRRKGKISESEKKVRAYVRNRLEEKLGIKKTNLTESVKSEKMKKLNEMIDKQFKLYKTMIEKKK